MKKILQLFLIACLLSFGVKGQVFTPIHNYQQPDGLSVLKYFGIPYGDTPTFNGVTRRIPGALFYSTSDSSMYGYTGSQWLKIGGNGISTINIIDSSHISVCNLSGCDTFSTTVNAQLVHVLSDTSFAICDTLANCDTFRINQTQFSSTLFDTTTIYNLLYQRLPISDTADENGNPRWMPYGIVQDTTARINDSVTVQTYTDGTSVYDTSRFAFTQENITAIQNINNYLDSLQGPDTTFIRGPTANGSDVLYATQDPNSNNDTLHLEFPHNSVGLDSLAQFDADGNVKQIAISDLGIGSTPDGSETIVTSGTNVTVTGTGTSGDPYIVNASGGLSNYDSAYVAFTIPNDSTVIYRTKDGRFDTMRLATPNIFTRVLAGLVPASGGTAGDTLHFLREDGSWASPTSSGGGLADSAYFWKITGNNGLTPYTHFIGNIDNKPFDGRVNNQRAFHIDSLSTSNQTSAYGRTFFGYLAGNAGIGTLGQRSTYMGYKAGQSQDGVDNVAIGFSAFAGTGSSTGNVSIGPSAGFAITSGGGNILIGKNAGAAYTTQTNNIAIGNTAGQNNTGSSNTLINVISGTGAGSQNTAVGLGSFAANTSGSLNAAYGNGSLAANTNANANTAIGINALNATTNSNNGGFGSYAGAYNVGTANQVFVNTLNRTNYAGDTAQSPLYAQESTTLGSQKVNLTGRIGINAATPAPNTVLDISVSSLFGAVKFPNMTTTKRDSITGSILTSSKTANGSGQTNGTYTLVPMTGGTGTGAVATLTIGSGALSTATFTSLGTNYSVNDVLTYDVANAGGTGTAGQVTINTTGLAYSSGDVIYNTTTNKMNMSDATRWTEFAKILSGSATLDFGNIAASGNEELTITVTGAADGDDVIVSPPNGSFTAGLVFTARVSSANTVSVQCVNTTTGGAIDPGSGTFKVKVFKD